MKVRSWTWRGDDSLSIVRVFSLAWLLLPIVFFSFSGSKLPGYVLPALPAAALLIADVVRRRKPAVSICYSGRDGGAGADRVDFAAAPFANRESVRDLLALADARVMQTRRCSRNEVTIVQRSFMRTTEWFITRTVNR